MSTRGNSRVRILVTGGILNYTVRHMTGMARTDVQPRIMAE
jgi:hypothetical protein